MSAGCNRALTDRTKLPSSSRCVGAAGIIMVPELPVYPWILNQFARLSNVLAQRASEAGAMSEKSHEALVGGQFGARAEAYLKSAVHAQSPDLEALKHLMRGQDDARLLDLGCGGGHLTFNVSPLVREIVAYDLSLEMLDVVARTARERCLRNVTTQQGTVEKLPFGDGSFDVVASRFSAHHWHDLDAGLREAGRVLKPGGTLAII